MSFHLPGHTFSSETTQQKVIRQAALDCLGTKKKNKIRLRSRNQELKQTIEHKKQVYKKIFKLEK
jgi:hypothetical protein